MILKLLQQNKIIFFIIILLTISTIIFLKKESKNSLIVDSKILKTTQEKPISMPIQEKTAVSEKVQEANIVLEKKIDFFGDNIPFVHVKPELEIGEIMAEQKKLDTFSQQKKPVKNKEDFMFYYKIGLEDEAIEKLKSGEHLNSEMINGKVEFSKSF